MFHSATLEHFLRVWDTKSQRFSASNGQYIDFSRALMPCHLSRTYPVSFLSVKNDPPPPINVDTESTCDCSCYCGNIVRDKQSYCALSPPSVDSLVPAGGSASQGTLSRLRKQIDSVWIHEPQTDAEAELCSSID